MVHNNNNNTESKINPAARELAGPQLLGWKKKEERQRTERMRGWRSLSLASGCFESPGELPPLGCSSNFREEPQPSLKNLPKTVRMWSHQCVPGGQKVTLLATWGHGKVHSKVTLTPRFAILHLISHWPLEPAPQHERGTLSDVPDDYPKLSSCVLNATAPVTLACSVFWSLLNAPSPAPAWIVKAAS